MSDKVQYRVSFTAADVFYTVVWKTRQEAETHADMVQRVYPGSTDLTITAELP